VRSIKQNVVNYTRPVKSVLTQFYLHTCDMMTNRTIGVETRKAIPNIEMA